MSTNPYESPQIVEAATNDARPAKPIDPLRLPAKGCLIIALAGFFFSTLLFLTLALGSWVAPWSFEHTRILFSFLWLCSMSCLALAAGRSLRTRRRRWLVLLAVAASFLPPNMFGLPVAALILMRIFRQDVWRSFQ